MHFRGLFSALKAVFPEEKSVEKRFRNQRKTERVQFTHYLKSCIYLFIYFMSSSSPDKTAGG